MNKNEIEAKVVNVVSEMLGVEKNDIHNDDSIILDLRADSLNMVEIVMCLEEEFGIDISEDEWEKESRETATIGTICEFVSKKLEVKGCK